MITFEDIAKILDKIVDVHIEFIGEPKYTVYNGLLGKLPLVTYLYLKNMSVCYMDTDYHEEGEEGDSPIPYLNILVKKVDGEE